nr:MAG TPA: hypothetical protein [Caudoviricetes sp.]
MLCRISSNPLFYENIQLSSCNSIAESKSVGSPNTADDMKK